MLLHPQAVSSPPVFSASWSSSSPRRDSETCPESVSSAPPFPVEQRFPYGCAAWPHQFRSPCRRVHPRATSSGISAALHFPLHWHPAENPVPSRAAKVHPERALQHDPPRARASSVFPARETV